MSITIKLNEATVEVERLRRVKAGTIFSVYNNKDHPFSLLMKLDDSNALYGEWGSDEDLAVDMRTGKLMAIDNDFQVKTYSGVLSLSLSSPKNWLIEDNEEDDERDGEEDDEDDYDEEL